MGPGPAAVPGGTHVVFLALQLLGKLVLVGLQLVQGFPELLGLLPGRRQQPDSASAAAEGRPPAAPRRPQGDPSPQLVVAQVVDVERLASLRQDLLLHLPGRLLLASLLVGLGGPSGGLASGGGAPGGPGMQAQAGRLHARAHLGQVAAVVGAHGGQSLLLLEVVLRSPLGVLLLPPGFLLLRTPRPAPRRAGSAWRAAVPSGAARARGRGGGRDGAQLTASRFWRSLSFSARIRCCSALSARRFSCSRAAGGGGQSSRPVLAPPERAPPAPRLPHARSSPSARSAPPPPSCAPRSGCR